MTNLWIVLGATSGEWRSWIEGIFTEEKMAYAFMESLEEEDDCGGECSYYIEEGGINL